MTVNDQTSSDTSDESAPYEYDVLVIGAGAAGVGVATALKHAGVEKFGMIDRATVGASFDAWPAETRFITPSFPTNSVGMLDINSIAIGTSPAFSLGVEHPTGQEFAAHLRAVAGHFRLPVCENTEVLKIEKLEDGFRVIAEQGSLRTKHVIWAGGEYQYPRLNGIAGSEFCRHTATIPSYGDLEGDDFIVIGGYESGVDAAYHLACQGKRVRVFDRGSPWQDEGSEPSIGLSPFSLERMRRYEFLDKVELHPNTSIESIIKTDTGFEVVTSDGESFQTSVPPLLAHGFEGSQKLVSDLFEMREDGFPLLNENDESTIAPGMFLCGPAVRHNDFIFCFIYKYRQRFAVVAKTIATSLGLPAEGLEVYRSYGMYLDDLSCCGEACVC